MRKQCTYSEGIINTLILAMQLIQHALFISTVLAMQLDTDRYTSHHYNDAYLY